MTKTKTVNDALADFPPGHAKELANRLEAETGTPFHCVLVVRDPRTGNSLIQYSNDAQVEDVLEMTATLMQGMSAAMLRGRM